VKSTNNIRIKQTLSPFWVFMVFVALLSSCTIRKGVQASLHIPVSEQLNPSKTTTSGNTSCIYFEADKSKHSATSARSTHNLLFLSLSFVDELLPVQFFNPENEFVLNGWPLSKKVKQYILFSRLKYDIL